MMQNVRNVLFLLPCLFAACSLAIAEEEQEPLPDPLSEPERQSLHQSGYLGGGNVPPSLQEPSRFSVGDFALRAKASTGLVYDDNVEADENARDEDIFLTLSPSVRAQSTYARHSLGIGAGATAGTALKNSTDDFFDWRIGADGRIDLERRSTIDASVSYSQDTEDDEDVDSEDDDGDTPIHNIDASLGYDVQGEKIGIGGSGTISRLDVEGDDFDDRDRTAYGLNGRVRYQWSEDLTLSGGPSFRYSAYDDDAADDGDGRDALEFGLQTGAGYRYSRTITTRASLGYALVSFSDSDREDQSRLTGSAGLTFAPGNGLTLDLQARRSLGLSIEDNEDTRTSTNGSATLAHRLKLGSRSALSSSLALGITRFSDLDRTDKNLLAGVTFAYRLAESAFLSTSYRFSLRDSDEADADYYRNLISIGLTVSY